MVLVAESSPMFEADAPKARIASKAFFFTGGLASAVGMEVSVNCDRSSSSAAEMSGPRVLAFDCDRSFPAPGELDVEAAGIWMGGREDSEKKESSSSGNGVSFSGCVLLVFDESGDVVVLEAWESELGEDGCAGTGESLSVNQSSSSSSELLSAAIPGARKFCSQ